MAQTSSIAIGRRVTMKVCFLRSSRVHVLCVLNQYHDFTRARLA